MMNEVPRDAVIRTRFAHPGELSEADVWARVAKAWSTNSDEANAFFSMMNERRAFPNTPAIANANSRVSCGSACFVLPINDSLYDGQGSITGTLADASRVHQYGGGTGFNFSEIRPKGATVASTGRQAPGPVSFLQGYSSWFKGVSQAGLRPAANMAIMNVEHPDIEDFISCKEQEGDISNFNISVALTDDFMAGIDGVNAGLWHDIVQRAWSNGEPGVFFVDTVNERRLHPEEIHATNPCGEVPLLPYEACVLGSIDLSKHVTSSGKIDYPALANTTRTLTRMLDNIVELQDYPLDVIREQHHKYRKIGVGVMGYADALIEMGVRYGSSDALAIATDFMSFIQTVSYETSITMAQESGTFPGYMEAAEWVGGDKWQVARRNLCCQVIAPTGTISWLAGLDHNRVSPGIEPNYGARGQNFILGGVFDYEHRLADDPNFVSYDEVTLEEHLSTQAAFQNYTDQAVSKTINLPNSATIQDVDYVYRRAHALGCKGVTVYREGSREEVVLKPEGAVEAECVDGTCAM